MSYQPLMRRPLSTIEFTAEQEEEIRKFVNEMMDKDRNRAPTRTKDTPSLPPAKRTLPRRAAGTGQSSEGDLMDLE